MIKPLRKTVKPYKGIQMQKRGKEEAFRQKIEPSSIHERVLIMELELLISPIIKT